MHVFVGVRENEPCPRPSLKTILVKGGSAGNDVFVLGKVVYETLNGGNPVVPLSSVAGQFAQTANQKDELLLRQQGPSLSIVICTRQIHLALSVQTHSD
jgi:hypothetical protein